jgi:hypothetical protein
MFHQRERRFSPSLAGNANDSRVEHGGVSPYRLFEIGSIDVEPAGDDDILLPVEDVEIALLIQPTHIASLVERPLGASSHPRQRREDASKWPQPLAARLRNYSRVSFRIDC